MRIVSNIMMSIKAIIHSIARKIKYRGYKHVSPSSWIANNVSILCKDNLYMGESTNIAEGSTIMNTRAKFIVKGNSAFAIGLTVVTGNHARLIGKYITDIKDSNKPDGYDHDVVVEKDVWLGCNVTLLTGVTIGRGCTIAANAVVTKDTPPYSICAGVPARIIKFYWTIEQILEHESKLYPEEERLTRKQLEDIFRLYSPDTNILRDSPEMPHNILIN